MNLLWKYLQDILDSDRVFFNEATWWDRVCIKVLSWIFAERLLKQAVNLLVESQRREIRKLKWRLGHALVMCATAPDCREYSFTSKELPTQELLSDPYLSAPDDEFLKEAG